MTEAKSGDIRTIFAASLNRIAACSFDWAALFSCELTRASGPQVWSRSRNAASVVLAFFRPNERMPLLVPAGLS